MFVVVALCSITAGLVALACAIAVILLGDTAGRSGPLAVPFALLVLFATLHARQRPGLTAALFLLCAVVLLVALGVLSIVPTLLLLFAAVFLLFRPRPATQPT